MQVSRLLNLSKLDNLKFPCLSKEYLIPRVVAKANKILTEEEMPVSKIKKFD